MNKTIFFTCPDYYHRQFLTTLNNNIKGLEHLCSLDILSHVLKIDSIPYKIALQQKDNNIFFLEDPTTLDFSRIPQLRNKAKIHAYEHRKMTMNAFKEYLTLFSNMPKEKLTHLSKNPVIECLNEQTIKDCKTLNLLYKSVELYTEDVKFILVSGTNRSIVSPLLGSRKIVQKLLMENTQADSNLINQVIDKANTKDIDTVENFFDSLILYFLLLHAKNKGIHTLGFCHGAQALHVILGGFINYSFKRHNMVDSWNSESRNISMHHPLERYLGIDQECKVQYFNSIFMEYNPTLFYDEGYCGNEGILMNKYMKNTELRHLDFISYKNTLHGSQLHIEDDKYLVTKLIENISNIVQDAQSITLDLEKQRQKLEPIYFNLLQKSIIEACNIYIDLHKDFFQFCGTVNVKNERISSFCEKIRDIESIEPLLDELYLLVFGNEQISPITFTHPRKNLLSLIIDSISNNYKVFEDIKTKHNKQTQLPCSELMMSLILCRERDINVVKNLLKRAI
jgi:hypothetical protein